MAKGLFLKLCSDLMWSDWGWCQDDLGGARGSNEDYFFRCRERSLRIEKTDDGYIIYLSALPVFSYKHNRGSVSYKTFDEAKTGMAQWLFQGLRYENSTSG